MKLLLAILLSITVLGATAQTHLFIPSYYNPDAKSKWQLKPFASLSAGYIFLNGGGISYAAAPIGLALYRPLNPNWTAFAAATVTPVFLNFNQMSRTYHGYPIPGRENANISTGIQGGLIYTNDAKTFSISGSVHIERDSYPLYAPYPVSSQPLQRK